MGFLSRLFSSHSAPTHRTLFQYSVRPRLLLREPKSLLLGTARPHFTPLVSRTSLTHRTPELTPRDLPWPPGSLHARPGATQPQSPTACPRGRTAASGRSSTPLPRPLVPPRLQPARARLPARTRLGARAGGAGPRRSQVVPAPGPRRSAVAVATRERQRRRRASPAPPPGRPAVGSDRPARAVPASRPALAGRSERPPVRGSRLLSGRAQLAGATMLRWSCRRGANTGTRLPGRPGRPAHHRRQ